MKKEESKVEVKTNQSQENEKKIDGSTYRKVENKKHKTGITIKRFILIVLFVVVILGLIIGIRWRMLYNIQQNYNYSIASDNWHYYSDSDTTIMNVYKKGSIWKMNTKQKNGEGNLTFWRDLSTNEAYVFYEEPLKKYSEDKSKTIINLPSSGLYTEEENTRLLMAATPTLWIGLEKYDGINCYVIGIENHKEYIDQSTGLLLATFDDNKQTRSVEYEFGKVTDEDVAKPDVSEYEYLEQ